MKDESLLALAFVVPIRGKGWLLCVCVGWDEWLCMCECVLRCRKRKRQGGVEMEAQRNVKGGSGGKGVVWSFDRGIMKAEI